MEGVRRGKGIFVRVGNEIYLLHCSLSNEVRIRIPVISCGCWASQEYNLSQRLDYFSFS